MVLRRSRLPEASPGRLRPGLALLCTLALALPAAHAQQLDDDSLDEGVPLPAGPPPVPAGSPPLPADRPAPTRPEPPAAASPTGYERAPIRWNGALMAGVSRTGESTTTAQSLSLNADSYFIAPYIAQVNGVLSLSQSQESATPSTSRGVSLGGRLALFNRSRWPTTIGVNLSESSVSGREVAQTSTGRGLNIEQVYRPQDDSYVVSGALASSRFASSNGDLTTTSSQSGAYTPRLQTELPQTFSIEGFSNTVRRTVAAPGGSGAGLTNRELRARHSIDMGELNGFRFDTNASINQTRETVSGAGGLDYRQLASAWNYLPEDIDARWTLNGNVSANQVTPGGGGGFTSYLASVALGNQFSRNWSGALGLQANTSKSDTGSTHGYGAIGSVSWTMDSRQVGAWYYGANAGGGLGVSQSGGAKSAMNGRVGAGQSLSRSLDLPDGGGSAMVAVNQSLGVSHSGGELGGNTRTLSHSLSSSWNRAPEAGRPVSATVTAQDTRSTGLAASSAQSVSASGSSRWVPSWRELITVTGGLDYIRQGSGETVSPWRGSGHFSLNYNNQKLFDVPRLRGSVDYRMVMLQANRGDGDGDGRGYAVDHFVNAQSTYRLGLLDMALRATLRVTPGGQAAASIGFTISRTLGGTL